MSTTSGLEGKSAPSSPRELPPPPTPPREAAAHGMGVFVCVFVGRAFGRKVTRSPVAAGEQGSR